MVALKDGAPPQTPLKAAPEAFERLPIRAGFREDLRRPRRDALPEHTQYADTGCEVHHSCLTCPLVRCRFDEPGGTRVLLRRGRDVQMAALQRRGKSVNEIARRYGVSRRTVFRALARVRG
jgi:transcriptional regulator of acetoin/glycerol metabolism